MPADAVSFPHFDSTKELATHSWRTWYMSSVRNGMAGGVEGNTSAECVQNDLGILRAAACGTSPALRIEADIIFC